MIDNITSDSVQTFVEEVMNNTFRQQNDHFIDFSQPFPLHSAPHPQSHSPKIHQTALKEYKNSNSLNFSQTRISNVVFTSIL
jgi:hypothetical protein